VFGLLKKRRRAQLRAQPLPAEWRQVVEKVALCRRLPAADRAELHGHIQVLLAEKRFEGCGGLEITDEIRVTIAAQAAVLLLHRDTDYFPTVSSVLVYPKAYWSKERRREKSGLVAEYDSVRLGEAWHRDLLVLAWDEVRAKAGGRRRSVNLVLHEFAHALDHEDGAANGAPLLPDRTLAARWAPVMEAAYEQLKAAADEEQETVLDSYGAQDPAEFFAIATEAFFEVPGELRDEQPELYDLLKSYFRQDPATEYARSAE